jgi:YbbR domain-containing protein
MKRAWDSVISALSSDLGLRIFSLVFAVGLWLFVNVGQKPAEWPFQVPVELRNVPSEVMVSNAGVDRVEVRMIGPPAVLSTVDANSMKIVLDLEGARPGNSTFRLGPDFFNPPRGVRIARINPSVINLRLDSVAARSLPVTVRFGGKVPVGYKIARVEVNPMTVKVQGPANEVNRMGSVDTQPIELEGKGGQFKKEVRLSSDGQLVSLSPDRVTVLVTLEEEIVTKVIPRLEVKGKNFAGKYAVSPGSVYLRLSGPKRIMDQLQIGADQAYIDLKGLEPGNLSLQLSFSLPPEVKVLEQKPDRFKVRIFSPTT